MNIDPYISIVVPVYNAETYLSQCIESIINQTYSNWELLLINDGSLDGSGDICDKYSLEDKRISVIHQKNTGVSKARNFALSIAKGDFVTFIDADDWIEPDFIRSFLSTDLTRNSLVLQGILNDFGNKLNSYSWGSNQVFLLENIESSKFIEEKKILHFGYAVCKLYSMKIIKENNLDFDERLRLHEDHIFFFRYLLFTDRIILSSYTGYHYMHRERISLSRTMQTSESFFLVSDIFLELLLLLFSKYELNPRYYNSCLQYLGFNQRIMGLFSLYFEDKDVIARNLILKREEKLLFNNPIFSNLELSIKMRFIMFFLKNFDVRVIDFCLMVLIKLFGSKMKKSINLK